jgi:hypothetical protein
MNFGILKQYGNDENLEGKDILNVIEQVIGQHLF